MLLVVTVINISVFRGTRLNYEYMNDMNYEWWSTKSKNITLYYSNMLDYKMIKIFYIKQVQYEFWLKAYNDAVIFNNW